MYLKLLDLLKETGFTFEETSKAIGLTRKGLYNKIYNKTQFTCEEMKALQKLINGTLNENYILEDIFTKTEKSEKK